MEEEIEEEKTQRPDSPLPLNMEGWRKKKKSNQTSETFQSFSYFVCFKPEMRIWRRLPVANLVSSQPTSLAWVGEIIIEIIILIITTFQASNKSRKDFL